MYVHIIEPSRGNAILVQPAQRVVFGHKISPLYSDSNPARKVLNECFIAGVAKNLLALSGFCNGKWKDLKFVWPIFSYPPTYYYFIRIRGEWIEWCIHSPFFKYFLCYFQSSGAICIYMYINHPQSESILKLWQKSIYYINLMYNIIVRTYVHVCMHT